MKHTDRAQTLAATLGLIGALSVGAKAATFAVGNEIVTFGVSSVDRLDLAGFVQESGFTYQAFGQGWELITAYGNPGASLSTFFNDERGSFGDSVVFRSIFASSFVFRGFDYRTATGVFSDDVRLSGYLNGVLVWSEEIADESTNFIRFDSSFSDPIDQFEIEVIPSINGAFLVDNMEFAAVPEPSPPLLLGLAAFGFVAHRRQNWANKTQQGNPR